MTHVLGNRARATRFRMLLWASYLVAFGAAFLAHHVLMTYGLSPGDGGVLKPLAERIAVGMFVLVIGLCVCIGMTLYAPAYVLRLGLNGQTVVIETLTATGLGFQTYKLGAADIQSAKYYHGRFMARRPSEGVGRTIDLEVDAPFITLRFRQQFLPFVLDLQAKRIDRKVLAQLAPKAVAAWRRDRPYAFMGVESLGA
jgi:hypothetical protein